tara:strand:+ start:19252 stop:19836 length:585 start_codon:yes stop_codon:yes gene_type:complete
MALKTSTLPYGLLNPATVNDFKRKANLAEEDPLRIMVQSSYTQTFGVQKRADGIWTAVVMRVEEFDDGHCKVICRVPELDGTLPEPVEWVDRDVESQSHMLIDLHRVYVGKVSTRPKIGQLVEVWVPSDNDHTRSGKLIKLFDQYVQFGIKSSELASDAKDAVDGALSDPLPQPEIPGGAIGSGESDNNGQVAS